MFIKEIFLVINFAQVSVCKSDKTKTAVITYQYRKCSYFVVEIALMPNLHGHI